MDHRGRRQLRIVDRYLRRVRTGKSFKHIYTLLARFGDFSILETGQ